MDINVAPQAPLLWLWPASWPPCASPRARCAITPSSSRELGRYERSKGKGVLIRMHRTGRTGCSDARAITSHLVIIRSRLINVKMWSHLWRFSPAVSHWWFTAIVLRWVQLVFLYVFAVMLVSHFNHLQLGCGSQLWNLCENNNDTNCSVCVMLEKKGKWEEFLLLQLESINADATLWMVMVVR